MRHAARPGGRARAGHRDVVAGAPLHGRRRGNRQRQRLPLASLRWLVARLSSLLVPPRCTCDYNATTLTHFCLCFVCPLQTDSEVKVCVALTGSLAGLKRADVQCKVFPNKMRLILGSGAFVAAHGVASARLAESPCRRCPCCGGRL